VARPFSYDARVNGQVIDASHINQVQSDLEELDAAVAAVEDAIPSLPTTTLAGLTDVELTALTNGHSLIYDDADNVWKNTNISAESTSLTVAASNTPAALSVHAHYICDGTDDQDDIQAAWDEAVAGTVGAGTVFLLPGTYHCTDTIALGHPTNSSTTTTSALVFQRGAKVSWASSFTPATGQALIKVESSDVVVDGPWLTGKGTSDTSVGLSFGGPVAEVGGRFSKTVYRSMVLNPKITGFGATSTGIGILININDTSSSGDNIIVNGFIDNCGIGVHSIGFVNRLYGTTIANCKTGIDVSSTRFGDSKFEVYGATINASGLVSIRVRGGSGTILDNIWIENVTSSTVDGIILGEHTSFGDAATNVAVDCLIRGNLTMHCAQTQTAGIRFVNARGTRVDDVRISSNGYCPEEGFIGVESYNTGHNNRVKRIRIWPGPSGVNSFRSTGTPTKHKLTPTAIAAVTASDIVYAEVTFGSAHRLTPGVEVKLTGFTPSEYNGYGTVSSVPSSTKIRFPLLVSSAPAAASVLPANGLEYYARWWRNDAALVNDNGIASALVVEELPDALDSDRGAVIGGRTTANPDADYTIARTTASGRDTYFAKNALGHVYGPYPHGAVGGVASHQTGLRDVLDVLKAADRQFHFGPGTFAFTVDPLGKRDHGVFTDMNHLSFTGAGIDVTFITNTSNAAEDTEPLSFTSCDFVYMRDFTVSAGGTARSTSDALDFDDGCDCLIERVKVTASRGRGIVFDGKDTASSAVRNTVRDCVVDGSGGTVLLDGIELLAAEDCVIDNVIILNVTGHGIQEAKASPSAAQANKSCAGNIITNCLIRNSGQDGINLQSSLFTQIVACRVYNSSQGAGSHDGLRIATADNIPTLGVRVVGGVFADTQGSPTQRYGVNVAPGVSTEASDIKVVFPAYYGNATAATNNSSTQSDVFA
jgi:hypothetical protein